MSISKSMIRTWLKREKAAESDYMLVVCDTFDYEDYPVYVSKEEFKENYERYNNRDMQKIMEIYDLHKDIDEQLNSDRIWNIPKE